MISALVDIITTTLLPLGFWGVFLASLFEEVLAPIPSAIVIMSAGITFLSGQVDMIFLGKLLFYIVLPASFGIVLGSLFVYYLAYFIGKPFIEKWGKWLWISWSDIEKIEDKYRKGNVDAYLVFILRAIPMVPSVAISAFSGLTRIPIKTYIVFSLLGSFIRTSILGFIGYQVGRMYYIYADRIDMLEKWILLLIMFLAIVFVIHHIYKKKHEKNNL